MLVALAACGGAPVRKGALAPITTRATITPGAVVAVEEIGDTVVVFDEQRAFTLRGGTLATVVESPRGWRAGATVAAPDGEGRWVIGIDRDGHPWHVTIAGELEDAGDRFALAGAAVLAVAGAGATTAFALGDGTAIRELAFTDGVHVARAAAADVTAIAVAPGRIATMSARGVAVWDVTNGSARDYPLAGARAIAFVEPALVVAAGTTLFVERGGRLARVATAPAPIRALAAAGARLWVLADRVYMLDGDELRAAGDATSIHGSPSGDVWLASRDSLVRATLAGATDDAPWRTAIAPVFVRVCAHCHRPGGEAGIDLSTPAAWHAERAEIRRRVLVTRTMPPAGTDLSDADRAAIAAWLR